MVSDDLEPDPVAAEDSIDLLGDDYTAASSVVKDNSKKPFPTPYFLSSKISSFFSSKRSDAPISPLNSTTQSDSVNNNGHRKLVDPNSPYDKASKILFDDADEERDQILFTDTFLRTGNVPPYPTNLSTNLKTEIESPEKHTVAAITALAEDSEVGEDRSETKVDGDCIVVTDEKREQGGISTPAPSSSLSAPVETASTTERVPRKGVPPLSQGTIIIIIIIYIYIGMELPT